MRATLGLAAFLSITSACASTVELRGRDGSYGVVSTASRTREAREVVIELFGALLRQPGTLVAWARVDGNTRRLGPLAHKPLNHTDEQGLLRVEVPRAPCDVLITLESSPDSDHPGADVVATAHLQ